VAIEEKFKYVFNVKVTMGIKEMLELEDEDISEEEIIQKITEALEKNSDTITLQSKDGEITIKLQNLNPASISIRGT
jgi:translation initiation factor IF-2